MLLGILIITSLVIIYYLHYYYVIVEYPEVYAGSNIDISKLLKLRECVYWTFWCYNSYCQFILLYKIKKILSTVMLYHLYHLELIILPDSEELTIGWSKNQIYNKKPKAILVLIHSLFGDLYDNIELSNSMISNDWLIVSYTRRGHNHKINTPIFSTTGIMDDLLFILDIIEERYPDSPIYAVSSSIGCSLLTTYLSKTGINSKIRGAATISTGFNFEEAIDKIPLTLNKYLTLCIKKYYLSKNKKILELNNNEAVLKLENSNTLTEWHNHQYHFTNHNSHEEYVKDHTIDLEKITIPIMYINSLDDMIFNEDIVKKYKYLADICPNTIVVHTKTGGHLTFFEKWNVQSWSLKIIQEFLLSIS